MNLLKAENIHKSYGSVHALDGVDFKIDQGECRGLVGDNGAGKSTLVKVLDGYIKKDAGRIYWKGEEVDIRSVRDARELGIETVYQDDYVLDALSVAQNIFYGREITKWYGFYKTTDNEKMENRSKKILKKMRLNISPRREVGLCSGGEKRGTAIARAMLFKANLVIMDEPTTGLAVTGVKKVLDFIRKLGKSGVSVILISHNLEHMMPVVETISVMRNSKIIDTVRTKKTSKKEITYLQIYGKPK